MRKGKRGQKTAPPPSRGASSPKERLRQQAYACRAARNFGEAKPLLEELYKLEPDNLPLALDLGEAYMETEDFGAATSLYAKLIEKNPKNISAVTNLGGSLIRQGKLNDARSILEYALQLDPKSIHARINLGSVLQASGERKANLDNALEAVQIDPSSSLAFNNLGSAFSDMAMFKEAKHAYETAVMLDSQQVDALINLAAVEARLGDSKASAEMYERVLKLLPKEAEQRAEAVKFYAAFEYLKQGVLEKGWDYYEGGFSPLVPANGARSPRRTFSVPRWDGKPLNGKTLLVWREQGLGDELLFYTCLHELKEMVGNIIVECDKRLVEVMARSFPEFTIRAEIFLPQQESLSPHSDFDFHLPLGSLMRYFRPTIESFNRSGAYIKPDPAKVAKFQERLAHYKDDYRLVGICWRSGTLNPVRNLNYTTLDEWGDTLTAESHLFVTLQYGHSEEELQAAEQKFGIQILRWPDLDLRNDLDDVFALIKCLDGVISVQTAVLVMAGVVGIPSVGVKAGGWTNLGCGHRSPWFNLRLNTSQVDKCLDHLEWVLLQKYLERSTVEPFWWGKQGLPRDPFEKRFVSCIENLKGLIRFNRHSRSMLLSDFLLLRIKTLRDIGCILANFGEVVSVDLCAQHVYSLSPDAKGIYVKFSLLLLRSVGPTVACELISKDVESSRFDSGDLMDIAVVYAESNRFPEAIQFVRDAYSTIPDLQDGFFKISIPYIRARKWSEALEIAKLDLELSRISPSTLRHLGQCFLGGGYKEYALSCIENAYTKDEKLTDGFTLLSLIPAEKGDWLEAYNFVSLDIQLGRLSLMGMVSLAVICYRTDNVIDASKYLDQAVKGGVDLKRIRELGKRNCLFDLSCFGSETMDLLNN